MYIVYNAMGAVFAILGLFLAVVAVFGTGFIAAGFITLAIVWCWFGRRRNAAEAPAIGYIPLCYWGILAGVLAFVVLPMDLANRAAEANPSPSSIAFKADEDGIRSNKSDDPAISESVTGLISQIAPPDTFNVGVSSSEDAVLILVRLETLNEIGLRDRAFLLEAIEDLAEAERPGVKVFAALKGRFTYGGILTPDGAVDVGKVVLETPLLAFYEANEATDSIVTTDGEATQTVSIEDTDEFDALPVE